MKGAIVENCTEESDVLAEENAKLRALVLTLEEALAQSEKASERMQIRWLDAIETMPDGFAMFDNDHRLVTANMAYSDNYAKIRPLLVAGAARSQILQAGIDHNLIDTDGMDGAVWVQEREQAWRDNEFPEPLIRTKDGGWLRLVERRTPSGILYPTA